MPGAASGAHTGDQARLPAFRGLLQLQVVVTLVLGLGTFLVPGIVAALAGYTGHEHFYYRLGGAATLGYGAAAFLALRENALWGQVRIPLAATLTFNLAALLASLLSLGDGDRQWPVFFVLVAATAFSILALLAVPKPGDPTRRCPPDRVHLPLGHRSRHGGGCFFWARPAPPGTAARLGHGFFDRRPLLLATGSCRHPGLRSRRGPLAPDSPVGSYPPAGGRRHRLQRTLGHRRGLLSSGRRPIASGGTPPGGGGGLFRGADLGTAPRRAESLVSRVRNSLQIHRPGQPGACGAAFSTNLRPGRLASRDRRLTRARMER